MSCLLTLYTAVMSFEILFPFGLCRGSPGHPPGNSLAINSDVTRYRGGSETDSGTSGLRQLYLVQLAPKNTQNGVRVRKLRPLTHPPLTVLPWYCNKPFTTAEESMNLGCAGASKAQERVQNLAHGHPRGVGCSLTVVVLSLVHAGSLGG